MTTITRTKCIVPFTILMVHHHGYCYSCCPAWTKLGNVGKLTESSSIMDIWNNERMQYIRQAVLDDRLEKVCNFKYCPHILRGGHVVLESLRGEDEKLNRILDQIGAGQTIMDQPPHILEVSNSGKCNLKCVMCQSNDKCLSDDEALDERLYRQLIPEILPGISKIFLSGNGEVFYNSYSRRFLQTLNSNQEPPLKIQLLTNGLMFTPKLWESIQHNLFECIMISIDAASKETYEKIRRNGKWEVLRQNLDFIRQLREQWRCYYFQINFTVMKSNYREMKDFVKLGRALGCDRIVFQKIFGWADIRENINLIKNKKVITEIARMLNDPIFNGPDVDTTQINEYRKEAPPSIFWGNTLVMIGKEWFLYYLVKAIFSLAKHFSVVVKIYEWVNQKRIPMEKPAENRGITLRRG